MADDRESYLTWRETAQPEQPQQPSVAAPEAYTNWRDEQGALASERAALLIENAIPAGDAVAADARAAEARGQGMELAPDLLADAQSELSRRIEAQTRRAQLMTSSRLSGWVSQDPMNAALAQMELQNLSTTASLFNSLGRGFDRTATGWWNRRRVRGAEDDLTDLQNVIVDRDRSFGSIVDDIKDGLTLEDFDMNPGVTVTRTYATALSRFISSRLTFVGDETLERHEGILVEELDRALQLQAANTSRIEQSYGVSTNVARMNTALHDIGQLEGVGEQMSALGSLMADEPGAFSEWLANVVVESAPGLTAGAATTYATRQPAAGAVVMGTTSYVTGEATTFDQFVREAGYDLNDPEQRAALVNDPEMRQLLRDRAFAYGAVVGMFDAASGGVASRTFVNNPAGELMLQSMAQSLMGGGGEAFAQLASGQDLNMVEIMVEGLAEFATAPIEAAGVGGRYLQERRTVIQDREFFDALAQSAGESEMRIQAPARYRSAIEALTADGPVENLYVDARALDELFQSDPNGVTAEQFLNAVPGVDAEAYRQALETGGAVEIPTASYASDIVGTRFDELVREHLRTQPENMSAAELRAYKSQLDDLSTQAQTIADRAESGQTELERVAEDARVELVSALRRAGRTADVAENEALQAVAFARTTAERMGIELDTFLQRYPLADVQSALDSDPSVRTPVVTMEVLERVRQEPTKDDEAERELMTAMREAAEVADLDLTNADPVDLERAILEAYGPDESAAILNQLGSEGVSAPASVISKLQIPDGVEIDVSVRDNETIDLNNIERTTALKGAGRALLERLTNLADAEDVYVSASVRAEDAALLDMYEQLGFVVDSDDGEFFRISREPNSDEELFQSAPPTESEAFKAWFGDSKVVDENGEPLVVYHGTTPEREGFEAFDTSEIGSERDKGFFGNGFYFTASETIAETYAENDQGDEGPIMSVYLSVQEPYFLDMTGGGWGETRQALIDRGIQSAARSEVTSYGGATYAMQRDEPVRFSEQLKSEGYDGVIIKLDENDMAEVVVFEPTQIKSVDNQGTFDPEDPRILYQKKDDKRGSILLPTEPDRAPLVTLFPKADLSTFLHESGHYYLHVLQDIAARGEQSTSMSEDWQTINDWWRSNIDGVAKDGGVTQEQVQTYLDKGTTGDKDVDRKVNVGLQEQWARAYESYLMAGKAPSNALRSAFEAFSAWLLSVYRRAKGLNVEVSDDLRGVFDRLLATDEEIAAATADNGFDALVAQSAEQLGIDETEYQKLVKLSVEAQDEAKQKLLLEVMAPVRRAQTEAYRTERKGVEAEITEKVNAKPANRVREWLGNQRWLDGDAPSELADDLRLDRQLLIDEHGEDVLATLPRGRRALYAKDTGLSADDVAGWFGYKSGSEMLQDIATAPKAKDEIKTRTEAEMRKRHGDPLGDGSIEARAVEALHGEKRGQLLAAELKAIRKSALAKTQSIADVGRAMKRTDRNRTTAGRRALTNKLLTRAQAAEIARRTIRQMPIRKAVRSGQYLAAERRAGERASLAVARGDMDAAFTAKHEQLLNHQLYVESRKADMILSRVESRVAKLKSKGTRKNLAGEYLDAIDDILTSYDFRKSVTQRAAKRRAGLQQYVEMMKAAGRENELAIPAHVLDEAKRRPYKTLPVNELEGVLDSLRNIEHTARMKQKLRDAQRERELTEVVGSITAEMEANLKDNAPNRVATPGERAAGGFREFVNLLLNADTLLRKIGGFDRGDAYDAIKAPIDDAADWASVERERAAATFEELYSVYDKKEQRQMAVRRHYDELGGAFTKWDLISAALNMGNSDNLARLMDKDSGGGFNAAQVEFIKQQLDKRDWDFVQSAWEVVNSYWPQIEARERRLTGVAPKKVQAAEVETPYGTYQGGYYPIRYRSDISGMVASEELAEVQQRMMAGRFGKAQTRNGHLEERAQGSGGRVLQLGMEVMHQHIGQVVHDLAFSEAVANSWRVLQDPRVRGAFEQKGLLKDHQALEMWLQDTATGQLSAGGVFGRLALRAKNGFTLSKLAFNMSTVAIQLTGITQSVAVLGSKNMAHGYSTYLSNPKRTSQEVVEMSPFMRERETTFNRDINDILGDVMVGPAASRAQRFQQGLARVGFWLMQKVQFYGVDVPTWYAGYRQGLEKFRNDEAKARSHADRMVARAQASGVFSDRAAFERGTLSSDTRQNGFVRLFTALGSYMFAKGNVAYEVYGRTARDVDGMNLKSLQAAVKGAVDMALLFTVEAIAYNLIKGTLPGMGDDDDDQSWAKFLARETALSMMSTIPGVRDLGSSLAGFEAGAYGSVIETFTRPMIQAAQGEADMALFKALSNAAGVATGLPSGQLNRTADAWYRLEEGDDVAPIEFIMGRR